MTETSPLGSTYASHPDTDISDYENTVSDKLIAGRRIFGVDMRIVDDEGNVLAEDGKAEGHLHVRGPWVASGYFKGAGTDAFTDDGWFATGDVSKLHPNGFMEITDRSKDVIKSGGEWVSSIDVENAASDHPDVAMAACIGIRHEKWQERPFLSSCSLFREKHRIRMRSKNASPQNVQNGGYPTKSFSKMSFHSAPQEKYSNGNSK